MPTSAMSLCAEPGCPEFVAWGRCETHRLEHNRVADRKRGSGSARGYTRRWAEFSREFLKGHPLCECDECTARAHYLRPPATDVDHTGGHSRTCSHAYEERHLQALSHAHHATKTARDDGSFGRTAAVARCRS